MKLSKHPVGTIINIAGEGKFEKVSTMWKSLERPNTFYSKEFIRKIEKKERHRITILAAPWSVVVELMQMCMDEYGHRDSEGNLITFDSVYKDAITRDEESKRIKEQRDTTIVNYCVADVKATESLINRMSNPTIYKSQRI
jgi:hypothetical protein